MQSKMPDDRIPTMPARWSWVLASALVAVSGVASAEPERFEIDPEHLSVGFLVSHIDYARVLGMFQEGEGSFTFDEETGELSDLRMAISTDSVFTDHEKRDEHLRSPDFLNAAEFPEMVYTAAGASSSSDREYQIDGELELLGSKRPVPLQATWNKSGRYPFGGGLLGQPPYAMGVSIRGSFKRSEFGMTYGVDNGLVGDEVELIIEFEAQRQ